MNEAIFTHASLGTTVTVYQNRVEVHYPGCLFGKRETIFLKNIASIEQPPLLNAIDIKTTDGKLHRVSLMPPAKTKELKDTLTGLL